MDKDTTINNLIEARDSLSEAIDVLEAVGEYAPQPVAIVDGIYRFRENPIVTHLLDTHPSEDMNTIARRFYEDRAARSQFAQLIGYSVSGAGDLPYSNGAHLDGAQQTAEVMSENEELRARVKGLEEEHGRLVSEHRMLREREMASDD